ncbi:hypothetical protein PHYPSEUDO_002811 [Phytophthora pseudosyringae]|uniref:Uncharacterized protein n=1 Tax=Phytophthora pseudosyringae TaxID=221518 RepID=A0A8T1VS93_9STRA|nr:hypothetical protein PHYPSEUDO_002811 [Phytophthora pseudosyringae]
MESQPLAASSASTISSVLENSELDDQQSNASYDEEQFESESAYEHEHEPVVAVTMNFNSNSGSEKYGSDEFEDDQEGIEAAVLGDSGGAELINTEENDYGDESFERDESPSDEDAMAMEINPQTGKYKVRPHGSDEQQPVQDSKTDDKLQSVEGEELSISTQRLDPQLAAWCSTKIQELRCASSKPESSQPHVRKAERGVDKIPAAVVDNLIHRASSDRQRDHRNQQRGSSWLRSHQQLKVPTAFMQRVQTQRWLVKPSEKESARETLPTSTRSPAPTFCSVKRENLLGQLATMQLSETSKRWAAPEAGGLSLGTLDLVQNMAAKQREICAVNAASDGVGGRMLHRVTMTTRLQLEDSRALRSQADALLNRLST